MSYVASLLRICTCSRCSSCDFAAHSDVISVTSADTSDTSLLSSLLLAANSVSTSSLYEVLLALQLHKLLPLGLQSFEHLYLRIKLRHYQAGAPASRGLGSHHVCEDMVTHVEQVASGGDLQQLVEDVRAAALESVPEARKEGLCLLRVGGQVVAVLQLAGFSVDLVHGQRGVCDEGGLVSPHDDEVEVLSPGEVLISARLLAL
eukprot:CAMPEP_0173188364 /NCGR_PEP_ID=MMETSP1141-20130122/11214_1 /TAXON_ID=483371 /ORGANISM="non described non described, Strain CCMP2298" /LENGTH=203 /DNA_ID=CAMNT_0014112285 /DNA_START=290 /DNA_END=900 /DNA_ORIENTATION=-